MTHDWLMVLLVGIAVAAHVVTWVVRPRQIEDAVKAAIVPLAGQVSALERRIAEQESRSDRVDVGNRALEVEIHRRLQEVMVHITRMEGAMVTRTDYERLHGRISQLGRDMQQGLAEIGAEVAETQAHANQAITRVQRVEQHLMEKDG